MKKTLLLGLLLLIVVCGRAVAGELHVGERAADFTLQDSDKVLYNLNSPVFQNKVLSIFYVDPDEADLNEHISEALKKAADQGILDRRHYKGFGITNLKATWKPNFIIKAIVKRKKKKYGTIILLDYDYTILNLWGLENDTSNLVILDKNRICRYLHKGRVPEADLAAIIKIIKKYQNE
ncbi:MAG: hypothetical protein JRJ12_09550 [Deltaproteobacteria bacterium]|nr:hypothetical protein [Deltaproteobacteria bacterium]MBW2072176.1 hypothetical protein [Deltaproteobacteria bacterium]